MAVFDELLAELKARDDQSGDIQFKTDILKVLERIAVALEKPAKTKTKK